MSLPRCTSLKAFTLIELSIVVMVLALLAAAAMRYFNSTNDAAMLALTNSNLDVIETALINYRNVYGRLPCPANINLAENTALFGVESGTPGDGKCTGATHANTGTDPDSGDPNYDSSTINKVVDGSVPTKTLMLADKYAYDAWGEKIFYNIDIRYTASLAFNTYGPASKIGAVVVKKTANDTLANALSSTIINSISYNAIYALVSTGENAHGGFIRSLTNTSTRFNAASNNSDELANCHCSNTASFTGYNRIFVQKSKTIDTTAYNDNFDDIVRFKTRTDMLNTAEMQ